MRGKWVDPPRGDLANSLADVWLPAVRSGMVRYGDTDWAIPIGSATPIVMAASELPPIDDWSAFDAAFTAAGPAAIPTAIGHAGYTLLARLPPTGAIGLFDRNRFTPTIDAPENVEALRVLRELVRQLPSRRGVAPESGWTPAAIGDAVAGGELRLGWGWPPASRGDGDLNYAAAPSMGDRLVMHPMSPVALISSRCRQSRLAGQFCQFISGGQSSTDLRRRWPSATPVRRNDGRSTAADRVFADMLQTPLVAPTMRILGGAQYYGALDEAVHACLTGDTPPAEALRRVSQQFEALTEHYGRENQLRAMRRNLGFTA